MNAVADLSQPSPVDAFVGDVLPPERRQSLFSGMPSHIKPAVFERNLVNAIMANTNLMKYDPRLVYREVSKAAGLGLLLDPQLGEAYIIESWNYKTRQKEPLLRVGYRGLTKLARQSGEVEQVYAHEVYSEDHLECDLGVEKRLVHKPILFSERGVIVGYYAVVKYKGGDYDFEPMSVGDVHAIRDRSDAWKAFTEGNIKSTPWSTDDTEMSKKTVIRRLVKRVPQSPELADALRLEDQAEGVIDAQVRPVTSPRLPPAPQTRQVAYVETHQQDGGSPETGEGRQEDATREDPKPESKPAGRSAPKPAETKADPVKVTSGKQPASYDADARLAEIEAIFARATNEESLESLLASEARPIFDGLKEKDQKRAIKLYEDALARLMDTGDDGQAGTGETNGAGSANASAPNAYDPEPILAKIQQLFDECESEERLELVRERNVLPLIERLSRSDQERGKHIYNLAQKRIADAAASDSSAESDFPGDRRDGQPAAAEKAPKDMTDAELEAYIRDWLAASTDATIMRKRWFGEAELRDNLDPKVAAELRAIWKRRTDELSKG